MQKHVTSFIGTLGMALVLLALMPEGQAFAIVVSGGTDTGCAESAGDTKNCNNKCSGSIGGESCSCIKRSGSCSCDVGG